MIHISSSLLHDLVFVLALWVFTLLFTNCITKTLKNLFFLIWFIEIVLACSLVVWEQFMELTYLAPLSGMKLKHTFPGLLMIQLVLRGGLKPTNFKRLHFTKYFTVATKGVGTRSRPSSPLHLGVSDLEQILKTTRKIRRSQSFPALCIPN